MSEDLDNKLGKVKKFSNEVEKNLRSLRVARIQKNNFSNPLYYSGNFLNHHLAPVRTDLARPFKLRKARKPYWRQQSPYGLIKPYDTEELRGFGNTAFVNQCKTIIISETLSADYEIVPTDDKDFSNDTMQKKRIVETFFKAVNRNGDTLKDALKPFLNDVLDLGMGVMVKGFVKDAYFHVQRTRSTDQPVEQTFPTAFEWTYVPSKVKAGMLRELTTHDAGTFYAQPDEFGLTIGWWQWLNQTTPTFFSNREVVDFNYQPLSYNAYGISPVDVVKNLVNVLVTSVANMEQYMEDGAIPPAVGILQGVSDSDFNIFADRWDASVAGQQSEIPLMSTGEAGKFEFIELVKSVDQLKQLDTIEAYQKIVMSVFHVTPAELGITDAVNKASAEQQSAVQKRAAIFPLLDGLENLINKYILREFDPDRKLTFKWIHPKTIEEEEKEWGLVERQLQSGFYTINDIKKKKGEPLKAWGNVPFSEGVWAQLASEFDPELFGFKEQKEDAATAKIEYAQRQVLTLLEQMQYGLQNDKELTPVALQVLTRLKLMREALHPAGSLSLPPSSVVETENMIDAMQRVDKWQTTAEIFDKYKNEDLEALRQIKKLYPAEEEEVVDKAVGVKGTFNPFKKNPAFYMKIIDILDKKKNKKLSDRLDKLHDPIEEGLAKSLLTTFRSWAGRFIPQLRKFEQPKEDEDKTREGIINAFPSTFMQEASKILDNTITMDDFREIIKDSFVDSFRVGFRRNNLGQMEPTTAKTNVKTFQPRAYNWLEQNSLYFSDSLATDKKDEIKGIILRGLAGGQSVPTMTKEIKEVLAPDTKEGKKKLAVRAKRIARTEVIRASVQGALAQMKTLGAIGWQHHTHFDERNENEPPIKKNGEFLLYKGEKQTCRSLHGRIFYFEDEEKNAKYLPVQHPNCRCTILSVFKDRKPSIPEKKGIDIPHDFQWNNIDIVVKGEISKKKKDNPNLKNHLSAMQQLYDKTTAPMIKARLAIEILRAINMWEDEDMDEEEEDFLHKKGIEGLQNITMKLMPQRPLPIWLKGNDPERIKKRRAYFRKHPASVFLPPDKRKKRKEHPSKKARRLHVNPILNSISKAKDEETLNVLEKKYKRMFDVWRETGLTQRQADEIENAFYTKRNTMFQDKIDDIIFEMDGWNDQADEWHLELVDVMEGKEEGSIGELENEVEDAMDNLREELEKLIIEFDSLKNKKVNLRRLSQNLQLRETVLSQLEHIKDTEKALQFTRALKSETEKRGKKFSELELGYYNDFLAFVTKKRKETLKEPEAIGRDLDSEMLKKKISKDIKGLPQKADTRVMVYMLGEKIKSEKKGKALTEADVDVFIPEIISTNAEAGKEHKFKVNYRYAPNLTKKCKNCKFFMNGKCKIVAGDIKPEYVCDAWKKGS